MRFTRARSAAVVLAATLTLALAAPAAADDRPPPPELPEQASPVAVLAVAERVLSGESRAGDPEPTIALRDLRQVLDDLSGPARARAEQLFPGGDLRTARRAPGRRTCGEHVCVHFTTDPDSRDFTTRAWAQRTLDVLEHVWSVQVGRMGYRPPRPDGDTGGRLDVHLRDLGGGQGTIYGYCAPTTSRRVAPGECTLDNDYSRTQYPMRPPLQNLKVTAAHEFFHTVQFGYDSREDSWLMEATATWIEERVYDAIDDNRQYLPHGQLHRPGQSLDVDRFGLNVYGNWIWFEHLSKRYGNRVVRQVWQRAGAGAGMQGEYSIQAIREVLRRRKGPGFRGVYARFAGANTHPASAYREGAAYDRPRPARTVTLGAGKRRWKGRFRINHQASKTVRAVPAASPRRSRLVVRVDGPHRRTAPAVVVTVVRNDGEVRRRLVRLGRQGRGVLRTAFGSRPVQDVSVTAVNASTRYRWCNRGSAFACGGSPRDQDKRFDLVLRVRR